VATRDRLSRNTVLGGLVFAALTVGVAVAASSGRDEGATVRIAAPSDTVLDLPVDSTVPSSATTAPVSATTLAPTDSVTGTVGDTVADTAPPIAAESTTTRLTPTTTTAPTTTGASATTSTAAADPSTTCPALDGASARVASFTAAPPVCIDPNATYTAVLSTSKGDVTLALDQKKAPKTVNAFVFLARYKFYDGLTFHRIVPGFVVQGGDPLGNGEGGPGFQIPDELPSKAGYPTGSVAMANSGPNTNGSQFFIVSGDLGLQLPAQFTLFANVSKGAEVVKSIESLGRAPGTDGAEFPPSEVVTITSVKINATNERADRIPGMKTT
jgi:cyclophilin family peptidyl-prolyl cis-trans isomerase